MRPSGSWPTGSSASRRPLSTRSPGSGRPCSGPSSARTPTADPPGPCMRSSAWASAWRPGRCAPSPSAPTWPAPAAALVMRRRPSATRWARATSSGPGRCSRPSSAATRPRSTRPRWRAPSSSPSPRTPSTPWSHRPCGRPSPVPPACWPTGPSTRWTPWSAIATTATSSSGGPRPGSTTSPPTRRRGRPRSWWRCAGHRRPATCGASCGATRRPIPPPTAGWPRRPSLPRSACDSAARAATATVSSSGPPSATAGRRRRATSHEAVRLSDDVALTLTACLAARSLAGWVMARRRERLTGGDRAR